MTTLILAGEVIVATATLVETTDTGILTPDGVFPFVAGVTGTQAVDSLPADFAPHRYVWQGGALVRLPDPPPTQAEIDAVIEARRIAYQKEADHLFFSWQAALAENAPDQDAKRTAWRAKRAEIQNRYPYPGE